MMRFALLALAVMACGGDTTGPAPQTWPIVYDLKRLKSPNMPGTQYTTATTCNRFLRSSLEAGTLTLSESGGATVYVKAWREQPSSVNMPGVPCPSFVTQDMTSTKAGTYTISGSGAARVITVVIGSTTFASGTVGAAGFASTIDLAVPGWAIFGSGKPFDPLSASGWAKRP